MFTKTSQSAMSHFCSVYMLPAHEREGGLGLGSHSLECSGQTKQQSSSYS